MNNLTRRSFVKRSAFSAAAVAVLGAGVALAGEEASATCTVTVESFVYRFKSQPQRKMQKIDHPEESAWGNDGECSISLDASSGGGNLEDGDMPPPEEPETPDGWTERLGWVESTNDVLIALKDTLPAEGFGDDSYHPDENGSTDPSSTGEGSPPDGWEWTSQVRTKITREKVPYAMKFKFGK